MYRVKFVAASTDDRVLVDEIDLPFDPRLSPTIRMRRKGDRIKHTDYRVVPDEGVAEIVDGEPSENRIIVVLKEIR
ncbi:hypothetical protein [Actinoplanes sp. URMC 104]|uniref:hypothetical protein n=1 Tax=Actinoplanes sp. URMC 104 TaxID=3423409 RepID=UPI003F1A9B1F